MVKFALKYHFALICFVVLFTSQIGFSQGRYLGKKGAFTFGLGTNFRLMTVPAPTNLKFGKDFLIPKISLGYLIKRKSNIFQIQTQYMSLQNTFTYGNPKGYSSASHIDSSHAKSDNFKLSIGIRKFKNIAPIGFYFHFSLGTNFVFNRINSKRTTYNLNLTQTGYYTTYEFQDFKKITAIFEFPFGFGYTYPLNRRLVLDYGIKCSMHFFKSLPSEKNFSLIDDKQLRYANSKNIFQSNLFEFYVSIQLFSK